MSNNRRLYLVEDKEHECAWCCQIYSAPISRKKYLYSICNYHLVGTILLRIRQGIDYDFYLDIMEKRIFHE